MGINRRKFIELSSIAAAGVTLIDPQKGFAGILNPLSNSFASSELQKNFITPPHTTKTATYWWWFNARVDKEGITRDLTEFKDKGISEVVLINSAGGLSGVPYPAGVPFMSEEYKELYRYAMQEAKRLDIAVGINLCSGWCMGGPWIKPENSGRWYLQSELTVTGPQKFSGALPLPGNRVGYDHVFNPPGYREYINLPLSELDYRDTSVVAIQLTDEVHNKITGLRANVLPAKTNHRDATSWSRASDAVGPTLYLWDNHPVDKPIPVSKVVDLTKRFTKDGHLNWEVPKGKWKIIRTGHRMTGSKVMVAQPEADGLSIDWFDTKGLEIQFDVLGRMFIDEAAKVGAKPKFFCDDSFEDGFPNWTETIIDDFKKYRGYDPTPYLPALSGYIIESAEISDRFLHDYRKTLADLMANEHYSRFAELCHKEGILMQNESAGPSRSATVCIDGLKNLGRSDFPMGEFWLGIKHDEEGGLSNELSFGTTRLVGGPDGQNLVTKMTASASHIYGKETASAEAFTSYRHWKDAPAQLKQALDRAFCEGINRIALHTSTASRPSDGLPGYEYGAGTHFNPNVTWWEKSGAFLTYIARCQYLLRAGKFVADVLFYNGDNAPNLVSHKHIDPSLGAGYDYDVCNEEVLLTRLSVKNNRLVLPDGMSYRILALPDTTRMPVAVMKKIKELVQAGATIVGTKPVSDSGLKNYPKCDSEIQTLSSQVWGKVDGKKVRLNNYGQGRVFNGVTIREILLNDGVKPDFEYSGKDNFIDFIHRTTPQAEIYFLTNRHKEIVQSDCTFRIKGRKPQLWDAVTGAILESPEFTTSEGRITVSLQFDPYQSVFVIFPESGQVNAESGKEWFYQNRSNLSVQKELNGPWNVNFDPKWGGPETIEFSSLLDWSTHSDERIKYYSGKAVYHTKFDLKTIEKGKSLFLDLGTVKDIAGVKLNGNDLGTVWTSPWTVEITSFVKQGDNSLEIEVINQWPNRLIGDAALPKEKRLTNTNISFKKTDKLLPSGLLGPVTIKD